MAGQRGRSATLLCVGDVHGMWDDVDTRIVRGWAAVDGDAPSCVVFVGDFANEKVEVVRRAIDGVRDSAGPAVAALLGNHDAWDTTLAPLPMANKANADGHVFRASVACLGADNIGFGAKDLPAGLGLVGARPCSWGGDQWRGVGGAPARFYAKHFGGLASFDDSARRIDAAARRSACGDVVLVAHNGPTGLGAARTAPCGKDFDPAGGDWGDPDLAAALRSISARRRVPLVVFGHMHDDLKAVKGGERNYASSTAGAAKEEGARREMVGALGDTVCVNTAVVPRWRPGRGAAGRERAFTVVRLHDGGGGYRVSSVELLWVGEDLRVAERVRRYPAPPKL